MTSQPGTRLRRRRRKDVGEVFDQMSDAFANEMLGDDPARADMTDNPGMRSATSSGPREMVGPAMAPEVANSLNWTDSLVDALQWIGELPPPAGHVPSQRTRLRKILNMINHYMGRHPELQKLAFRDDIATLGVALDALNSGTVHPLLATQALNKPPDTKIDQQFRAYVVSFVHILVVAGMKEPAAFKAVAAELTRAGFRASRPTEKKPSTEFRIDTVRRWHHQAKPAVEERTARKNPVADKKALLGQHDSHAVFKMMDSFVANAISDGEQLPPTESYALEVIRKTLNHPTVRGLFARRLACA